MPIFSGQRFVKTRSKGEGLESSMLQIVTKTNNAYFLLEQERVQKGRRQPIFWEGGGNGEIQRDIGNFWTNGGGRGGN